MAGNYANKTTFRSAAAVFCAALTVLWLGLSLLSGGAMAFVAPGAVTNGQNSGQPRPATDRPAETAGPSGSLDPSAAPGVSGRTASVVISSAPSRAIDQSIIDRAIKRYEAANASLIAEARDYSGRLCSAAAAYGARPEEFLSLAGESFASLAADTGRLARIRRVAVGLAGQAGAAASARVHIHGDRAAVYFPHGESLTPADPEYYEKAAMPLYLVMKGGKWLSDIDYMTFVAAGPGGRVHQRDERAIESDANWFLAQYPDFAAALSPDSGRWLPEPDGATIDKLKKMAASGGGAAPHYFLAGIYVRQRYMKDAYAHARAAREMAPGNIFVEAAYSRIVIARKFGRMLDDRLARLLEDEPYNADALLCFAELMNARYRYDISLEAFACASALYRFLTPHYHLVRADSFESVKDHAGAGAEYVKCASYGPPYYYSRYLAGKAYARAGNGERAAELFESVIDYLSYADKKREVAAFLMEHHRSRGNMDAYYTYRRYYAFSFFNSPGFAVVVLLSWLLFVFRRPAARGVLAFALPPLCRITKNPRLARFSLDALYNLGKAERGAAIFSEYLAWARRNRSAEDHFAARIHFANVLVKLYRAAEALALFREALAERPGDPGALLGLGVCEYDAKNYDVALEYFMCGIESEPENHLFYYYAGLCHMMSGRRDEGSELIVAAYKVDSSFEPALAICESYFLGNNRVARLVGLYDDMLTLGDTREHLIDRALRLHISRMDGERISRFLEAAERTGLSGRDALLSAGCALREIGEHEKAELYFLKSIEASRGIAPEPKGPLARAANAIRRAVVPERGRVMPLQLLELGINFICRQMPDRAAECFERANRLDPKYPFVYYFLKDYGKSFELMAGQISDSELPWNNASVVEAIYLSLKEIKDDRHLARYREWGRYYANSFPDEFGIFSYKYLRHVPKARFFENLDVYDWKPRRQGEQGNS